MVADATVPADLRRRRRRRAGRARPRRPRLAGHLGRGGRRRRRGRGRPTRGRVAPPRRHRGDARRSRASASSSTTAEVADRGRQRHRPRAPRAAVRRPRRRWSPLVRHAGAVFCRPARRRRRSATTAPGRPTCCRPSARPGSPAPSRPTTSPRPIHVVAVSDEGFAAAGAARRSPSPRPRGSPPTPTRSASRQARRREAAPTIPSPRADVALMDGLPLAAGRRGRPAQHQRGARAAAGGVRRRPRRTRSPTSTGTATPTAAPRGCGPGIAAAPRRRPGDGVRRQRLERGAPDALPRLRRAGPHRRSSSSRPTPCTRHIARDHRHRGGRRASARADFAIDLERGRAGRRRGAAGHHVPVLAEQPDRHGRPARGARRRARRGARARRRRRGLRPVRAAVGDRRRSTDGSAAGRRPHVLEDVVDGRRPPRLLRRRRPRSSRRSTRSCCRTTSTP